MPEPARGERPGSPCDAPSDEVTRTADLIARGRAGDAQAIDELFARTLPVLRRWARGRLPRFARDLLDTEDLVQETLVQALRRLGHFEARHEGALQAYLRQAIVNRIRDELRRAARRPAATALTGERADPFTSPLDETIGREAVDRYEQALGRLRPDEREAIIGRVELGLSYDQLAAATDRPSADAARMAVGRALVRLAREMGRTR